MSLIMSWRKVNGDQMVARKGTRCAEWRAAATQDGRKADGVRRQPGPSKPLDSLVNVDF